MAVVLTVGADDVVVAPGAGVAGVGVFVAPGCYYQIDHISILKGKNISKLSTPLSTLSDYIYDNCLI